MTQQLNRLPDVNTPLAVKGVTQSPWYRLWQGLFSGVPNGLLSIVTPSSSPFTYVAPVGGTLIVNGGTVSQTKYSRDAANFYVTGQTQGTFPLSRSEEHTSELQSRP